MQETMQALRGLQELDEDIFRVKRELTRLPEERARRREGIDAKILRTKELEALLLHERMQIKEIEDLTRVARQRIRKLESEAASTPDAALIAAYQHEVRSKKREVSEAEEEGLGFVEKADAIEAELASLRGEIAADEDEFATYDEAVNSEIDAARTRLDELEQARKVRMSTNVEPDVLSQYERLLEAREGVALAALDGRVCQGCYMEVPPNVFVRLSQGVRLVNCPSCDRILYLERV